MSRRTLAHPDRVDIPERTNSNDDHRQDKAPNHCCSTGGTALTSAVQRRLELSELPHGHVRNQILQENRWEV